MFYGAKLRPVSQRLATDGPISVHTSQISDNLRMNQYIRNLCTKCQFHKDNKDIRQLELLYHISKHFEVKKFISEYKEQENLTYDIALEKAKAHEDMINEYLNNSMKGYKDPLRGSSISAVQKSSFQKPCSRCRTQHQPKKCLAHNQVCCRCTKKGHFEAVCRVKKVCKSRGHSKARHRSAKRNVSFSMSRSRSRSMTPYRGQQDRGRDCHTKERHSHRRNFSRSRSRSFRQSPYQSNHHSKRTYHIRRQEEGQNYKVFAISQSNKIDTDQDLDGKTKILTDIYLNQPNAKVSQRNRVIKIEVKVDPGAEACCMPLSHFRKYFPSMVNSDGKPKQGALEPTNNTFTSYSSGLKCYGYFITSAAQHRESRESHQV